MTYAPGVGDIPKREQLEALITGRTWDLAVRYAGSDHPRLLSMLDVTLEELVAHARERGLPETWVHREPGRADGLYLVEDGGRFCVYAQDRGRLDSEQAWFDTEPEAFEYLIETYYLP